jgi:hypothetical protein
VLNQPTPPLARILHLHLLDQFLGSLAKVVNYPVVLEVIFSERVIVRKEIHF